MSHTDGQGWIMTEVYDRTKGNSFLVVLDAEDVRKDPLGRIILKHYLP
ncbi:MAG: carotenoid oxygenase family protein [Nitrospirae bacterium]|nr:carotenoid oxygenase family protein [Nitrospirota bacterium]